MFQILLFSHFHHLGKGPGSSPILLLALTANMPHRTIPSHKDEGYRNESEKYQPEHSVNLSHPEVCVTRFGLIMFAREWVERESEKSDVNTHTRSAHTRGSLLNSEFRSSPLPRQTQFWYNISSRELQRRRDAQKKTDRRKPTSPAEIHFKERRKA
jgi:hypothetical protein